jgi:hypothetical protein
MSHHVSVETGVIPSNKAPGGGRDPVTSWPGANTGTGGYAAGMQTCDKRCARVGKRSGNAAA